MNPSPLRVIELHMEQVQDYTIKNGIGIRVRKDTCHVIRFQKGVWNEIGQGYTLPVEETLLVWTSTGIPASTLAVALRVYELDNPTSQLRRLLTSKPARALHARAARQSNNLEPALQD